MDTDPEKTRENSGETKAGGAKPADRPRRMMPPVPPPPANPGAPGAGAAKPQETAARPQDRADPTRFGDWEKNGRCIDF